MIGKGGGGEQAQQQTSVYHHKQRRTLLRLGVRLHGRLQVPIPLRVARPLLRRRRLGPGLLLVQPVLGGV